MHLRDDYQPNQQGVAVRDDVISNDYYTIGADGEQRHNHHKSYGYLRTPEMAEHVKKFLGL